MASNTCKELRNQVIYQIFTRNYKDGTFKAVENDLPRIKALGTDIVYLLPIQPSGLVHRKGEMGSPYAIRDYRAIDPVQGTLEDFVHLCDSIHAAGMKIMIDVVYNHTSPDSVLSKEHPEWFFHKADGSFGNQVGEWWDVIDLDYRHMDLWDYQIDTLKMWAQYVDGFRCDVAPMIPLDFWKRARKEVSEIKPDFIWLAESVEPFFLTILRRDGIYVSTDAEMYQAFDICYDYDIYDDQKDAITGRNTLAHYLDRVNRQECSYPDNYSKLRFMENHDQPRAAAFVTDDKALRNWTAWIYFVKGTTMIYAGQEACVRRHPTLFDRDTVDFNTGKDLSPLMTRLSEIKKDPLFAYGMFSSEAIGCNDEIILAKYEAGKNAPVEHRKALGIFSTTGRAQSLALDLENGSYTDLISGKTFDIFEKIFAFEGEPVILMVD